MKEVEVTYCMLLSFILNKRPPATKTKTVTSRYKQIDHLEITFIKREREGGPGVYCVDEEPGRMEQMKLSECPLYSWRAGSFWTRNACKKSHMFISETDKTWRFERA